MKDAAKVRRPRWWTATVCREMYDGQFYDYEVTYQGGMKVEPFTLESERYTVLSVIPATLKAYSVRVGDGNEGMFYRGHVAAYSLQHAVWLAKRAYIGPKPRGALEEYGEDSWTAVDYKHEAYNGGSAWIAEVEHDPEEDDTAKAKGSGDLGYLWNY